MKKKILIIGCGYAGVVASWQLAHFSKYAQVTVVDRGKSFNFLPLLPDSIGRRIPVSALSYPIQRLSRIYNFNFLNEEVTGIDLDKHKVITIQEALDYDYLIIASGSETDFYGNEQIKKYAYKLDDVLDAQKLVSALNTGSFDEYIIGGGGYTGIEAATNLRVYLDKNKINKRIIIVERAPSILGRLPQWMKDYVSNNLDRLNIEVLTNTIIERIDENSVYLSGGVSFPKPMLIWAAGVRASAFLQALNVEKNPQGRIKVDKSLSLNDSCFVTGDASYFQDGENYLRMAVQFSVAQGRIAALNVIKSISREPLIEYKPVDLGYVVPMANNRSCGIILGKCLKGPVCTLSHYFMSIYRAYGLRNKYNILKTLIAGG